MPSWTHCTIQRNEELSVRGLPHLTWGVNPNRYRVYLFVIAKLGSAMEIAFPWDRVFQPCCIRVGNRETTVKEVSELQNFARNGDENPLPSFWNGISDPERSEYACGLIHSRWCRGSGGSAEIKSSRIIEGGPS